MSADPWTLAAANIVIVKARKELNVVKLSMLVEQPINDSTQACYQAAERALEAIRAYETLYGKLPEEKP